MKLNTQPLYFGAFPGGMDSTSDDYKLGTDTARNLLNVVPEFGGVLRFIGGSQVILTNSLASSVVGLGYYEANGTKRLIIINSTTGAGRAYAYNELTATSTGIASSDVSEGTPTDCTFAQFGDKLFITNYYGDGSLAVWDGTGLIRKAGIQPAPDAGGGGAIQPINQLPSGNLYSVGQQPYQWAATYEVDGLESNVSDLSPATYGEDFSNEKAELHFTGSFYSIVQPIIASGKTVTMHVYRTGGTLATLARSMSFTVALSGGEIVDASTGSYTVDNVHDNDVSTIAAPFSNQPPPLGSTFVTILGNRLFLVVGNRIAFSRDGQPEYFGEDENGVDDDGGYVSPNRDDSDPIQALVPNGGITIVGKAYSKASLYGYSFSQFKFDQVSRKGVVNKHSMTQCDNTVRSVARDRKVYAVGDEESVQLWKPVLASLLGVSASDLPLCRTVYHNGMWILVFPQTAPRRVTALGYDDTTNTWVNLTDSRMLGNCFLVRPNPSTGEPELLVGKLATDGGGVSAVFLRTSTAANFSIESGKVPFSPDFKIYRLVSVDINADFVSSGGVTVRLEVGQGSDQVYTRVVQQSEIVNGRMLRINALPANLVGQYVKFTISGAVSGMNFYNATFGIKPVRESVK